MCRSSTYRPIREGLLTKEVKGYIRIEVEVPPVGDASSLSMVVPADYVHDLFPKFNDTHFVNRPKGSDPVYHGFVGIGGELTSCRTREPSLWRRWLDHLKLTKVNAPETDDPDKTTIKNRVEWSLVNVTREGLTIHLSHATGPKLFLDSPAEEEEKNWSISYSWSSPTVPVFRTESDISFNVYNPTVCSRDPSSDKTLMNHDTFASIALDADIGLKIGNDDFQTSTVSTDLINDIAFNTFSSIITTSQNPPHQSNPTLINKLVDYREATVTHHFEPNPSDPDAPYLRTSLLQKEIEKEEDKGRDGYPTASPWSAYSDELASLLGWESQSWSAKIRTTERCLTLPGYMWETLVNRISSKYISCEGGRRWKVDPVKEGSLPIKKPKLCRIKMYPERPALPSFTFTLGPVGKNNDSPPYLRVPLESLLLDAEDDAFPGDDGQEIKPSFVDDDGREIQLRPLCLIGANPNIVTRDMIVPIDDNPAILFGSMALKSLVVHYDYSQRSIGIAQAPNSLNDNSHSDGTCAKPLNCPGDMLWSRHLNICMEPTCTNRLFMQYNATSQKCETSPLFVYALTLTVIILAYMHSVLKAHTWKVLVVPALDRHRERTE